MKKKLLLVAVLVATAFVSQAQIRLNMDVVLGRRPPNPNEQRAMYAEEQAHPSITEAMRSIQHAMQVLNGASDDFGGHRAEAYNNLQQAYWSLRKALYYKLYENR